MTHGPGDVLRLVKFSHTLFALPFALAAWLLAVREYGLDWRVFAWILVAMVGMRSAAMCFNRLVDAPWDARNPRTVGREIPRGIVSQQAVGIYTVLFSAIFFVAAWQLNPLALALSPLAWGVALGYSLCKRFTSLSHFVLGLALGLSPVGAWVAVSGEIGVVSLWMGLVVLLWTAGFDILYATMDLEFDRRAGLKSLPARWGIKGARLVAILSHLAMLAAWAGLVVVGSYGWPMMVAGILAAGLIFLEHLVADPADLGRMNVAFFKINVVVSLAMFAAAGGELWLQ